MPYVGDAPPPLQEAQTAHDARKRTTLRLDALTLGVSINNQVRTHDTQVYAFVLPLVIDPRTVKTKPVEPGKTRVTLQISNINADFVFQPRLATLAVGDNVVQGMAGFEFGMWDASGQRVSSGGRYDDRPVGERFALQDRNRRYLLSIDFPLEPPSPELPTISLDLSKALAAPGIPPLPRIRFVPAKWKEGYT